MAAIDTPASVVSVRVVYYGPPAAGKTTNLELISALIHGSESRRLTPRQVGENRIASLEIPAGALGGVIGSRVVVRLETIQGEVSSATGGWTPALADADGIVFVADSSPHARTANFKSLAGIRERLEGRGRSSGAIPVVMQWNKRDRVDARPIAELETELNHRCFPSIEAASIRGTGVAETLIEILKRTIHAAQRKIGVAGLAEAELGKTLTAAMQRLSQSAREASTKRFGLPIEPQPAAWPDVRESPRLRRDIESSGPHEVVYSAEALGGDTQETRMLAALGKATASLDDQDPSGLPRGLLAGLLAGCDRTHGSLLLFRPGTPRMEECEVVPAGRDPLNAAQPTTGVTRAATLCAGHEPLLVADQADEILRNLRAAWVVPLRFGSLTIGGIVVYVTDSERPPSLAERAYWTTAASLIRVHLAWQADKDRVVGSSRPGPRSSTSRLDTSES